MSTPLCFKEIRKVLHKKDSTKIIQRENNGVLTFSVTLTGYE